MNAALIYKKDSPEDRLTSDIFGLLRYLPADLVLWPFLQKAESFEDPQCSMAEETAWYSPVSSHIFFWPRTHAGREPDLLLIFRDAHGAFCAVVVEIKYTSGKHNLSEQGEPAAHETETANNFASTNTPLVSSGTEQEGDQLADYFRSLVTKQISLRHGAAASLELEATIQRQIREGERILKLVPADKCFLLYLTAHDSRPVDDMSETGRCLVGSFDDEKLRARLYWAGWRSLYEAAEAALNRFSTDQENTQRTILWDILRLLDLRQLRPFRGWKRIDLELCPCDGAFFGRTR
jgi:hypothetical protein